MKIKELILKYKIFVNVINLSIKGTALGKTQWCDGYDGLSACYYTDTSFIINCNHDPHDSWAAPVQWSEWQAWTRRFASVYTVYEGFVKELNLAMTKILLKIQKRRTDSIV